MTLDDQAKILLGIIAQMNGKESAMEDIANLILLERLADGVVIKLSQAKKQCLLNQYQILKGELQTLVGQLP